jgi:surface protein
MSTNDLLLAAGGSQNNDLLLRVVTTTAGEALTIYFTGVNGTISWGDGSYNTITSSATLTHNYSVAGTYSVRARLAKAGALVNFRIVDLTGYGNNNVTHCLSFGNTPWTSLASSFYQCKALIYVPNTLPSTVTSLSFTFGECSSFNADITGWNTANVTDMSYTFYNCSSFNRAIGSWNVSNVTTLYSTFQGCTVFNQPLNSWNTANVTSFFQTFSLCSAFNQSLSSWNTASATTMQSMFISCSSFNQPISTWTWNTSNVTNMAGMFSSCSAFNQSLIGMTWNTANVTDMSSMFSLCPLFNGSVSWLSTSNVTDMSYMFYACGSFNQSISTFDTLKVTNMSYMFYSCSAFNQPLNSLDVSKVTDFSYMFAYASSFNQPLNSWKTLSAVNMTAMFNNASSFAQNLSSWCVGEILFTPSGFATGAGALTPPVWGTCPSGTPTSTITRIGAATGVDSATLPAHQSGDLIFAFVFRDGSSTSPTTPSGWTNLRTRTQTAGAAKLAYKIATSSSETTGTWTNATASIFVIYRGAYNASVVSSGTTYAVPAGNNSSATVSYPANAYWSNLAWTLAFAGSSLGTLALETPPTGATTLVANYVDANNESAAFDSNGLSAAFALATVPLGTNSMWISMTFRLRVPIS